MQIQQLSDTETVLHTDKTPVPPSSVSSWHSDTHLDQTVAAVIPVG